jgi:hypothetical protein
MTLSVIKGEMHDVTSRLLFYALEHTPSLIIDCSNSANPFSLFPAYERAFKQVYVLQAELLYKLRDTLRQLDGLTGHISLSCIVVTPFHRLMSYDNPDEDQELLGQAWALIKEYSTTRTVLVGVAGTGGL